jgi:cell division protein ZapD
MQPVPIRMTGDPPRVLQDSLFPESLGTVAYEQPLTERIRTFLRLEHLFELVSQNVEETSEWASRAALAGMIDITDLLSRADLKAELIKEMDRQALVLESLRDNPGVDPARLREILETLNRLAEQLRSSACQPAQVLRRDELIAAIRQRIAIPGGTCNFDLPAFHHWLAQPSQIRTKQLRRWFSDLHCLEQATNTVLAIIRESAEPTREVASGGFFQQPLDTSLTWHLIRVVLPDAYPCFPEISAGRHRFTIRFLEQSNTERRPVQTTRDVVFDLERCTI